MVLSVFRPGILLPWLASMAFGVLVGGTPGLTATMGVALIIPVTYYMEPLAGMAMILGVSFTSIFTGDIPDAPQDPRHAGIGAGDPRRI